MADNIPITVGSGTTIATDDVSGVHYQRIKLVDGTLDGSTGIPGDAAGLRTKGNDFSVQVDFTVDAGAYAVGDALAAMGTFAGMASAAGKHAIINTIVLAPNGAMPAIAFNLWVLEADLATPVAKNAAFTIVAADAPNILGIVPISSADYIPSQTSWNVATLRGVGLEYATVATSLYIYLVCTAVTAPVATHVYLTLSGEFRD
jgi:hypothetical protein